MGKSAPAAPDYRAAAEETAESNAEALNMQTWANRMNQHDPWGSLTYDTERMIDPATGQEVTKWTQNQQFSPLVQSALDSQFEINDKKSQFASKMMDRAGNTLLQDTDYNMFQGYGAVPSAFGTDGRRVVNNQPAYQSPAPVQSDSAGWYQPSVPEAPVVPEGSQLMPNGVVIEDNTVPYMPVTTPANNPNHPSNNPNNPDSYLDEFIDPNNNRVIP